MLRVRIQTKCIISFPQAPREHRSLTNSSSGATGILQPTTQTPVPHSSTHREIYKTHNHIHHWHGVEVNDGLVAPELAD